jgi:hypothetical protein
MNLIRTEIEETIDSDFFEIANKLKDRERANNRKVLKKTNWWEEDEKGPADDLNVSSGEEDF